MNRPERRRLERAAFKAAMKPSSFANKMKRADRRAYVRQFGFHKIATDQE